MVTMMGDGGEQRMAEKNSMDNNKRVKRGKRGDLSISCMVNTEVGALLAVMRLSPGDQCAPQFIPGADEALDASLVSGLKSLRTFIFNIQQDWHSVDPSIYPSPFLEVIEFDEIAAPAVATALSATIMILKLEIFDSTTPHTREAMHLIVDAITNCRLERTAEVPDFNAIPSSPDEDVESFALVLINSAIELQEKQLVNTPNF